MSVSDPQTYAMAVARATTHAPFLRRLAAQRLDVLSVLAEQGLDAAIAHARADAWSGSPEPASALRRQRGGVALAIAIADLAGASLETVTAALTAFADEALGRAIDAAFAARNAAPAGFVALALGKQGSGELNYSSDIDPILLYDPDVLPRRPREEPGEAATRIARAIVQLLGERTAEGYVLRVDLRLRPAAEIMPPAVPIAAAITHYESSALPWERAAFIRARAAAGDVALGEGFLRHIRPFVWRRALDFGAVGEMQALTRRIRDHHAQGQRVGPGYDLKRGRGGIREVEFFAQVHQLIHGGRDPALRAPATLDALHALAAAGWIPPDAAVTLADGYRLLRTVEHRLQMVDDQQTHRLPADPEALDRVAALDGLAHGAALVARLEGPTAAVGRLYDGLEQADGSALPEEGEALAAWLAERGFADPAAAANRVHAWRNGQARTTRSAAAREALERVLPELMTALGSAPASDEALARFDDLVTRLPSAVNLFRLLDARPALVETLGRILSHAPALAAELVRRADLLDGLIDARALALPPQVPALVATLEKGAGEALEPLLDRVRLEVGERRFALGVQLVTGASDPLVAGGGYARLAEAALAVLTRAVIAEFERAHGRVPGAELLVLALGRLGGGVLTHASDLDLIYLFTGEFLAESDGPKPLGATTYFNRLCQRVTAALSVPTASGPLYSIDTRLRPSGNQGLLAVSLDSFRRYEAEQAWTWEHMALTRARPVFGSEAARAAANAVIADVLARPRDAARLTADAVDMRGQIARHKPPAGPYDVKLIEGGLVDAEFAVHLLQLRDGIGREANVGDAAAALEKAGLLAADFGGAVDLLTRMLIVLRLVAPDGAPPAAASRAMVATACGQGDWSELERAYAAARALVAAEWRRVAGLARSGGDSEETTR